METQATSIELKSGLLQSVSSKESELRRTFESHYSEQLAQEKTNEEQAARQIPFTKFFSYMTSQDKLLLYVGTFAAIMAGAILPSISLVMGNVAAIFSNSSTSPTPTTDI